MGIYIWGTGCSAGDLIQQGLDLNLVSAFIENHPSGPSFLGKPVLKPEQIPVIKVDLILIASRHSAAIYEQCLSLGLNPDSLFFLKNNYILRNRNDSCQKARELLPPKLLTRLEQPCRIIREPAGSLGPSLFSEEMDSDYVRIKTLELLVQAIRQVPGDTAELGVYRGFFARIMNGLMPDRKLYLFDSFEGFVPEESQKELEQKTCTESFLDAHKRTSAQKVLESMPHPEQVLLYPGYFPQSLNNLEASFALVSLDADFEATTHAGLTYFWPRLSSGGYIMLHDYNSPNLTGVKNAVRQYEQEHQLHLPGVPLCDISGTLVLCKP